ncbi:hypothetical protein [Nonomuraea africana]|uniref:hypothetical protein n=1 Tax=Nonomuraea africana TaxID=46171 RepID=UPI0033E6F188
MSGLKASGKDLRRAMETCGDQADDVAAMATRFAPAKLGRSDFGLAPGTDDLSASYVDGTPETSGMGRYEAIAGYLFDLQTALAYLSEAFELSARNYQTGHDASALRPTS